MPAGFVRGVREMADEIRCGLPEAHKAHLWRQRASAGAWLWCDGKRRSEMEFRMKPCERVGRDEPHQPHAWNVTGDLARVLTYHCAGVLFSEAEQERIREQGSDAMALDEVVSVIFEQFGEFAMKRMDTQRLKDAVNAERARRLAEEQKALAARKSVVVSEVRRLLREGPEATGGVMAKTDLPEELSSLGGLPGLSLENWEALLDYVSYLQNVKERRSRKVT